MSILRSLAFYLAFYSVSAVMVVMAVFLLRSPVRLRRLCNNWSSWHRWCVESLLGIRVQVEREPFSGPALYVMKHESFFEAIDMPNLFVLPVPFGKEELFRIPGWGSAARAYGSVEVRRSEGARGLRDMMKQARPLADAGRPLILFPEGTRVPHGQRAPIKSGFAALYKMLDLTVVPVAVDSGPLYHRTWKRKGTITYRFGEPIPPGLPRAEAEARVFEAINALNG